MSGLKKHFRFSLKTFLLLILLFGVTAGVMIEFVGPVSKQWKAVQPILDAGGGVETSDSGIPTWVKLLMPKGKRDNIEAVHFNRQPATDEMIAVLPELPHLRKLYLQKSRIQSKHLDTIGKLENLERLVLCGNDSLQDKDLAKLAKAKNLQLLDLKGCSGLSWRCLLAFRGRPEINFLSEIFDFQVRVRGGEVSYLSEIPEAVENLRRIEYFDPQPRDIALLVSRFPGLRRVHFLVHDRPFEKEVFEEIVVNAPSYSILYTMAKQKVMSVRRGRWQTVSFSSASVDEAFSSTSRTAFREFCKVGPRLSIQGGALSLIKNDSISQVETEISFNLHGLNVAQLEELGRVGAGIEDVQFSSRYSSEEPKKVGGLLAWLPNVKRLAVPQLTPNATLWKTIGKLNRLEHLTVDCSDHGEDVFIDLYGRALPHDFGVRWGCRESLTQLTLNFQFHDREVAGVLNYPNLKSISSPTEANRLPSLRAKARQP